MIIPSPCKRCAYCKVEVPEWDVDRPMWICTHPLEYIGPRDGKCIGLQYYKEKCHGKDQERQEEEAR